MLKEVSYYSLAGFANVMALITAVLASTALWQSQQLLLQFVLPSITIASILWLAWRVKQVALVHPLSSAIKAIKVCWVSVLFCSAGDLVNQNLWQQYHRQDPVIRHDYLIDSIWFFAPGYGLLLYLLLRFLRQVIGLSSNALWLAIALATGMGLLSFVMMSLNSASHYSLLLAGGYTVLMANLGVFAVILATFALKRNDIMLMAVAAGFLLATLADAVIGQFWLFGNNGLGYFPVARNVNWVMYTLSQSLVLLFPLILLRHYKK